MDGIFLWKGAIYGGNAAFPPQLATTSYGSTDVPFVARDVGGAVRFALVGRSLT